MRCRLLSTTGVAAALMLTATLGLVLFRWKPSPARQCATGRRRQPPCWGINSSDAAAYKSNLAEAATADTARTEALSKDTLERWPERNVKILLGWTPMYASEIWWGLTKVDDYSRELAGTDCIFTTDRSYLSRADLVVFHGCFQPHDSFAYPDYRQPSQCWVYLTSEASTSRYCANSFVSANNLFNLTATYKRDSDVVLSYDPRFIAHPAVAAVSRKVPLQKTKLAFWYMSDCTSDWSSRRSEYVRELKRHLTVDVFRQCRQHFPDSVTPPCVKSSDASMDACFLQQSKQCKFYLAFENAICRDYITEKLFKVPSKTLSRTADYARAVPAATAAADHLSLMAAPRLLNSFCCCCRRQRLFSSVAAAIAAAVVLLALLAACERHWAEREWQTWRASVTAAADQRNASEGLAGSSDGGENALAYGLTLVTAYFDVGRFEKGTEGSRDASLYRRWLTWFRLLENPVVAYFDDAGTASQFRLLRAGKPTRTFLLNTSTELSSFALVDRVRAVHASPLYPRSLPNTVNAGYVCAMHAKYELVERAIAANHFGTRYIGWADVGLFRDLAAADDDATMRMSWWSQPSFYLDMPVNYNESSVAFSQVEPLRPSLSVAGAMHGGRFFVAGGYFVGHVGAVRRFAADYRLAVGELLERNLTNVDQSVLYAMYHPHGGCCGGRRPAISLQGYPAERGYSDWFFLPHAMRDQWLHRRLVRAPYAIYT